MAKAMSNLQLPSEPQSISVRPPFDWYQIALCITWWQGQVW